MGSKRRVSFLTCALGLAAGLAMSPGAWAQDAGSWTVRGFGVRIQPTDDSFELGPPIDILAPGEPTGGGFSLDDGSGWGIGLEYRFTRRLGVEAQVISGDLDSELRLEFGDPVERVAIGEGTVGTDVYSLGLDLHLTPGRRIDVYAGLLGALVSYDDFRGLAGGYTFERRGVDDTAVGLALGADLFVDRSRRWAASASVRQLWSTGDAGDELGIDVDPRVVSLGVAYRWGGP